MAKAVCSPYPKHCTAGVQQYTREKRSAVLATKASSKTQHEIKKKDNGLAAGN
jgi:hypothetical protein